MKPAFSTLPKQDNKPESSTLLWYFQKNTIYMYQLQRQNNIQYDLSAQM